MKSIQLNPKSLLVALAAFPLAAFATQVDVTGAIHTSGGNIYTDNGSIYANGGYVRAQTYFVTPGYVQAGTSGSFGTTLNAGGAITGATVQGTTYLYSPGYLSITGAGYFGNFLRIGGATNTPAAKSVQIGQYATASSFNALVVGRYNVTTASDGTAATAASWVDKDPLFVVGNGNGTVGDPDQFRNALTVYKDGTITMSQTQGDILMGQFGN